MKKKILTCIILAALLLSAFAVSAFANEGELATEGEEANAFAQLYEFSVANADKIFSLLAFLGALILTVAYKKGLFPFVEKALLSLTAAVKSLREENALGEEKNIEFIKSLDEKLALSEKTLENALIKLSTLENELKNSAEACSKTEEFRSVLLAEVEMIYDIFISSSLPQYQKDKVGEAYAKMKRSLENGEA